MEKIKIGIIGYGHLGKMHVKNLSELSSEMENVELHGVYDLDKEKYKSFDGNNNIIFYDTLDELLENINTAFVITPTSSHFEIAEKAISKGINLFIEKPVTAELKEAYKLRELYKKNSNLIIQIGHIERFNPALLSVEELNLKPMFIESHRLASFNPRGTDVSVVQDLMIHDIDIILNLVKSKVSSIDATGVAILTKQIDIANARIKFENGCVANITASRISQKKMRKMRIFQKNAYISVDFQGNSSEVFRLTEGEDKNAKGIKMQIPGTDNFIYFDKPDIQESNPMKIEERKFLQCIKEEKTPEVTLEDGIQALEVALEIIKKSEESISKVIED